ncbi:hypothetical protein EON63_01410 [archaeon]|nr:MAG: hypothetical protein EON63_01410 [archaeon]
MMLCKIACIVYVNGYGRHGILPFTNHHPPQPLPLSLLPGAGAVELALGKQIKARAESESGLDQYGLRKVGIMCLGMAWV